MPQRLKTSILVPEEVRLSDKVIFRLNAGGITCNIGPSKLEGYYATDEIKADYDLLIDTPPFEDENLRRVKKYYKVKQICSICTLRSVLIDTNQ